MWSCSNIYGCCSGLQFIAVALEGIEQDGLIITAFDSGLALPYLFCIVLIIIGILIFCVELGKSTHK